MCDEFIPSLCSDGKPSSHRWLAAPPTAAHLTPTQGRSSASDALTHMPPSRAHSTDDDYTGSEGISAQCFIFYTTPDQCGDDCPTEDDCPDDFTYISPDGYTLMCYWPTGEGTGEEIMSEDECMAYGAQHYNLETCGELRFTTTTSPFFTHARAPPPLPYRRTSGKMVLRGRSRLRVLLRHDRRLRQSVRGERSTYRSVSIRPRVGVARITHPLITTPTRSLVSQAMAQYKTTCCSTGVSACDEFIPSLCSDGR